jgi:hypothetical protein
MPRCEDVNAGVGGCTRQRVVVSGGRCRVRGGARKDDVATHGASMAARTACGGS